jgi:hypothetical protein
MSKKKTAAEKRIASAPASAFRKLTKTELGKLGFSPKSERYIEIGRRPAKNVKTISKRSFTIKKTKITPEAAAKAHAEGELFYKSRKTQEAAEKQKITRERQRENKLTEKSLLSLTSKQIDRDVATFEKRLQNTSRVTPGPNSTRPREPYKINVSTRSRLPDLARRKLNGERLLDGDWHMLADAYRAAGGPNLAHILKS